MGKIDQLLEQARQTLAAERDSKLLDKELKWQSEEEVNSLNPNDESTIILTKDGGQSGEKQIVRRTKLVTSNLLTQLDEFEATASEMPDDCVSRQTTSRRSLESRSDRSDKSVTFFEQ